MEVAGYEVTQGPDVIAEMTSFSTDKSSGEGLPPATGCVCVSPLSSTAVALNSFPAMSGRLEGKKKEKKKPSIKDMLSVFAICDPSHLFSKPRFSGLAHSSRSAVEKS